MAVSEKCSQFQGSLRPYPDHGLCPRTTGVQHPEFIAALHISAMFVCDPAL